MRKFSYMDHQVLIMSMRFSLIHEVHPTTHFFKLNMYAMFDLNLMITKGERRASSDWSFRRFSQFRKGWDYNYKDHQVIRFIVSVFANKMNLLFLRNKLILEFMLSIEFLWQTWYEIWQVGFKCVLYPLLYKLLLS